MDIKKLRIEKSLTQEECASILGISTRTYMRYENDETKKNTLKYNYIYDKLSQYNIIDEEHGLLTIKQIIDKSKEIFKEYDVNYCYLFGSYSRGEANEISDIDLFVSMPVNGLKFYELIEKLREKLKKKVDLLDESQIENNPKLALEILRDGIKIYDKN